MKRLVYFLLICCLAANAQDKLTDIQYSSTPAATIIGLQNKELNTIHSFEALYSELISPVVSSENNIPTNLQIELAPYFLKSRDITQDELYKPLNFWKRTKISIASTKVDTDTENSFSRVGVGVRFNILKPRVNLAELAQLSAIILRLGVTEIPDSDFFSDGSLTDVVFNTNPKPTDAVKAKVLEIYKSIPAGPDAERRQALKEKIKEYRDKNKELADDFDENQTGFSLDLAGSFALDFPDNSIGYSRIDRKGLWLNACYKAGWVSFAGIGRISDYSFDPDIVFENTTFFDLGGNISIDIDRLKFSAEYIGKFASGDAQFTGNETALENITEKKWDASVSYQINDNFLISLSYSEAKGNNDYFKEKMNQLLVGLSAAIFNQ